MSARMRGRSGSKDSIWCFGGSWHWIDRGKKSNAFSRSRHLPNSQLSTDIWNCRSHISVNRPNALSEMASECNECWCEMPLCPLKQLLLVEQCSDALQAKEFLECTWHTFVKHHYCIQDQLSFLFDSGGFLHFCNLFASKIEFLCLALRFAAARLCWESTEVGCVKKQQAFCC